MKNRIFNSVSLITVLFLLGCAGTGSIITTGTKRPATNPDDVVVYIEAPENYEVLGIVETTGYLGWTDQGRTNSALKVMKKKAARIGANGILLESTGNTKGASVGSINNGVFMTTSARHKTASGKAIWVLKE
ncbi:hypothetical protein MLD52_15645 [Puniceicoccaceae bacterium K14]|nr:hypothetical protein [Puniceicoccaceae bacterium K14]